VIYPADRIRYPPGKGDIGTQLRVSEDGTFGAGGERDHMTGRSGDGQGSIAIESGSGEMKLLKSSK
jgi:hypothetical protein